MKKSVLICDDDEGIVDVATIILEEKGYQVESLTSAEHIIDKMEEISPEVVLLDLWMPEMSGEEITKKAKKNEKTRNIPIIIVSANKDTEKIARSAGADDFLTKPFDIMDLEKKVSKYVHS